MATLYRLVHFFTEWPDKKKDTRQINSQFNEFFASIFHSSLTEMGKFECAWALKTTIPWKMHNDEIAGTFYTQNYSHDEQQVYEVA